MTAHERREVEPVLLGKRQVEAVDAAQILHDLRLERLLEVEGTAGRDADEEEGDRDDQEQRRDRGEGTAEEEGGEGRPPPPPGGEGGLGGGRSRVGVAGVERRRR